MHDDELWQRILQKWILPSSSKSFRWSVRYPFCPLTTCKICVDVHLKRELAGCTLTWVGGRPRLQNLCLLDLLNELLYAMFSHSSLADARILSGTCKHLNIIS